MRPPLLLALGANLGDARATLEAALAMLAERGLSAIAVAPWVRSPAWPAGSGPDYLNGAALLPAAPPHEALALLHEVEAALGRTRGAARFGPRPCDLDLIGAGAAVMPGLAGWRAAEAAPPEAPREGLVLPHPRMHERAFVLAPLAAIAPRWRHPVLGRTVAGMLADLPEAERAAVAPFEP